MDVANFLNSMGAQIRGAGTDVIRIVGVEKLHKTEYSIIPDQIEAGTFMFAAADNKRRCHSKECHSKAFGSNHIANFWKLL